VSDAFCSGTRTARPLQLAGQLGVDEPIAVAEPVDVGMSDRLRPGPPQVLVRGVDDHLGVGDVVDRGDDAVADAEALVDHLHHRRQAVGGARRGGEQVVLGRAVQVIVHAHHDVERAPLDRRGDDHLAHAGGEVRRELGGGAELAAALEHDVDAGGPPRHVAGPGDLAEPDGGAIDRQPVSAGRGDVVRPAAVDRIELEQVRGARAAALDLVDVDEREVGPAPGRAHDQAPHASEAVDADADAHRGSLHSVAGAGAGALLDAHQLGLQAASAADAADQLVEHGLDLGLALRRQPVVDPGAVAAGVDHAGGAQDAEVPRHRRLRQRQRRLDVAHAQLALGQERHDPQPRLVGHRAQEARPGTNIDLGHRQHDM
jgi:hypothetical protein